MFRWFALLSALLFAPLAGAADFVQLIEDPVALFEPPPPPDGFISEPGIIADVYGHPRDRPLLEILSRHAAESVPRLADTLGVPIGGKIAIFVAEDDRQFAELQGARPPEWADATAWPERGTVYLRSPRVRGADATSLLKVLDHELTHVLLGRAFAPHEPPRWLQEGMARVMAGENGPADGQLIAASKSAMFSLENLHSAFPRDANGAQLAYAESADFVGWMRGTYGDDAMRLMIRELSHGSTMEVAVFRATGLPLAVVDATWRQRFEDASWLISASPFLGAAMGGLAVAALIKRRRITKQRMAQLAASEAEHDRLVAASSYDRYTSRRRMP